MVTYSAPGIKSTRQPQTWRVHKIVFQHVQPDYQALAGESTRGKSHKVHENKGQPAASPLSPVAPTHQTCSFWRPIATPFALDGEASGNDWGSGLRKMVQMPGSQAPATAKRQDEHVPQIAESYTGLIGVLTSKEGRIIAIWGLCWCSVFSTFDFGYGI